MSATPLTDAEYLIYMAGRTRGEVGHTPEGQAHAARLEAIAAKLREPHKSNCSRCEEKQAFIDAAFIAHPNLDMDVEEVRGWCGEYQAPEQSSGRDGT